MLRKIQLLYPLVSTSGLSLTSGITNIYDRWSDTQTPESLGRSYLD